MNADRRNFERPAPEDYSRATNPERFAPLHDLASDLLNRLELEFDVKRVEGQGLDPELEKPFQLVRPTAALIPNDADAAPLVIAFTSFPGLHVRFGRWCTIAFPLCGCDACSETADGEAKRLKSHIADLIAGRFREAIRNPDSGTPEIEWKFWSVSEGSGHHSLLDRDRVQQMLAGGNRTSYNWNPWPMRR